MGEDGEGGGEGVGRRGGVEPVDALLDEAADDTKKRKKERGKDEKRIFRLNEE